MEENLFILAVYFIEMLVAYIFFSRLSTQKYSSIKCWIVGTLLFECGALLNHCFSNTIWINAISFLAINISFALICFKAQPIKVFFYSCVLFVLSAALEFATIFIVSNLFGANITDYNTQPILLIIEGTICKALYFLTCLILLNFIKSDKSSSKFPLSFYAYPASTIISLLVFWYVCAQKTTSERSQNLLAFVCVLLLVSTIVLFITYQQNIEKENNYIILKSENSKLKIEKAYYDILEHQNHQLMIYAHDAKNHLTAIQNLNTNPQIDTYISEMLNNLSEYSNVCHSGNRIVDVIVNKYITECKINGIDFEFDIKNNNLSCIEYYDTVTILGNLLDNAVEAVSVAKEKYISFETDFRNNFSVIIISNSCDRNPLNENGDITESTQDNKRLHGFGLKSVRKTIKKYNGDIAFDYDSDKNIFVVTVMIES